MRRRRRRKWNGPQRIESDGFTTLDLVNGLQAVCVALDECAGGTHDTDFVSRLAMAAKILSTMVADRVEA